MEDRFINPNDLEQRDDSPSDVRPLSVATEYDCHYSDSAFANPHPTNRSGLPPQQAGCSIHVLQGTQCAETPTKSIRLNSTPDDPGGLCSQLRNGFCSDLDCSCLGRCNALDGSATDDLTEIIEYTTHFVGEDSTKPIASLTVNY